MEPKENVSYELRIMLEEVEPTVWRLIRVPDCTLGRLDAILLEAMGWDEGHLSSFEIGGEEYADVETARDLGMQEMRSVDLSGVAKEGGTFRYKYDFGDGWTHTIRVDRVLDETTEPVYLDGARACPPEDSGGPWGYADLLDALRDPNHESHEEVVEWVEDFDPEAFSVDEVNARLALVGRIPRPDDLADA